jgi:hypothetical protein
LPQVVERHADQRLPEISKYDSSKEEGVTRYVASVSHATQPHDAGSHNPRHFSLSTCFTYLREAVEEAEPHSLRLLPLPTTYDYASYSYSYSYSYSSYYYYYYHHHHHHYHYLRLPATTCERPWKRRKGSTVSFNPTAKQTAAAAAPHRPFTSISPSYGGSRIAPKNLHTGMAPG